MGELRVDLFCEDTGREVFTRALAERIAEEQGIRFRLTPRSARGGRGRAITELRAWLKSGLGARGGVLAVVIDANSVGWHARRSEILELVEGADYPAFAIGCPDPHVEAWLTADARALKRATGVIWSSAPADGDWKRALGAAVEASGTPILGEPMDLSLDVVPEMNLYDAGKVSPSLRDFEGTLRSALLAVSGS